MNTTQNISLQETPWRSWHCGGPRVVVFRLHVVKEEGWFHPTWSGCVFTLFFISLRPAHCYGSEVCISCDGRGPNYLYALCLSCHLDILEVQPLAIDIFFPYEQRRVFDNRRSHLHMCYSSLTYRIFIRSEVRANMCILRMYGHFDVQSFNSANRNFIFSTGAPSWRQ